MPNDQTADAGNIASNSAPYGDGGSADDLPVTYNDAKAAFIARPDVQAFSAAVAAMMAAAKPSASGHVDRETPLLAELPKHAREIIEGYLRFRLPHNVYVNGALAQMRITRGSPDV